MQKTQTFYTKELSFDIDYEETTDGKVTFPMYIKMRKDSPMKELTITLNKIEFIVDLQDLTPISLGSDWGEACFNQLQKVLQKHISKYQRILPSDLEYYVNQTVTIMTSITKKLGEPLSTEEQQLSFKRMLIDISKHLEIPVEINFQN